MPKMAKWMHHWLNVDVEHLAYMHKIVLSWQVFFFVCHPDPPAEWCHHWHLTRTYDYSWNQMNISISTLKVAKHISKIMIWGSYFKKINVCLHHSFPFLDTLVVPGRSFRVLYLIASCSCVWHSSESNVLNTCSEKFYKDHNSTKTSYCVLEKTFARFILPNPTSWITE